jgi:hypothetical protein
MSNEQHESNNNMRSALFATVATSSSKTTYAGGATAGVGWMLSNEFIGLCGLILATAGFVVNFLFRIREDRRQQELHNVKLAEIERRIEVARLSKNKPT